MSNPLADAIDKMRLFYFRRQDVWFVKNQDGQGPARFFGPSTKSKAIALRTLLAKRLVAGEPLDGSKR